MLCAPLSLNESKAGPDAAAGEQPFPGNDASGSLCSRQHKLCQVKVADSRDESPCHSTVIASRV
jgi:hypothetical protein